MDDAMWPVLAVVGAAIVLRVLYLRNGFLLTDLAAVLWRQLFPRRKPRWSDPHRPGAPLGHTCPACDQDPSAHQNGYVGNPPEWANLHQEKR